MTDTTNRVLSLAEVMALEEGARVWVEHRKGGKPIADDGIHDVALGVEFFEAQSGDMMTYPFILIDRPSGEFWPIDDDYHETYFGVSYRVWSLPQPPTPEEMERNPWRKEGEASE